MSLPVPDEGGVTALPDPVEVDGVVPLPDEGVVLVPDPLAADGLFPVAVPDGKVGAPPIGVPVLGFVVPLPVEPVLVPVCAGVSPSLLPPPQAASSAQKITAVDFLKYCCDIDR